MYVASAAYAAPSAAAYLAARGGNPAGERVEGPAVPGDEVTASSAPPVASAFEEEPIVGRYPVVAFSFNADASKLVLLYRDPATGETVSQIPSEVALKQYEEAQRKERDDRKPKLELVVGAAAGSSTEAESTASGGRSGASGSRSSTSGGVGASREASTSPSTRGGGTPPTGAASIPATAAGAAAYGGGGSSHVNLVI